ncbi:MAG: DNA polymerase III subunit chi [Alphaproteobacteria bacterium]|nr:DNA polymerase III subunit chi [Alphaproteobacteria bacterium]
MAETRFYHLQTRPVEQVLPQLVEVCLSRDWNVVIMTGRESRVEALCEHLWTFRDDSFIPHGTSKDGHAEKQPVWITSIAENPNNANVAFLVENADMEDMSRFELVCRLFDGNDNVALDQARKSWKREKETGRMLTYWQQTETGGWVKKAEANSE